VITIVERGRPGETYLIGADGEHNNRQIVAMLLEILDKPADWFDLVPDRPGHDLRYAIDSTKLRTETGWTPRYRDLRAGLEQTVAWYRANEEWWTRDKARTEEVYAQLGR
jgi:dTDP-glucose 4,6-dehydratase